jgi:hypothetical protein
MTTDKLLEAFTKHFREAKRNARIAKLLEKEIISQVKTARVRKAVTSRQLAASAKLPFARVDNLFHNNAKLKPSEAKTLIQAVNG